MRRHRWVAIVVVATTAGLFGCSSSKKSSTATASNSAPNAATIQLSQKNFKFDPSTFTLKNGEATTITVTNNDTVKHNLTIKDLKVDKDIDPGKTETVTVTAATAGSLEFHCEYHQASGMTGTITVT